MNIVTQAFAFVNNFFRLFENKKLVLIIKQTMAISRIGRICDLLAKLPANALIVLCALQSAGAIAPGALQSLFDRLHQLCILI